MTSWIYTSHAYITLGNHCDIQMEHTGCTFLMLHHASTLLISWQNVFMNYWIKFIWQRDKVLLAERAERRGSHRPWADAPSGGCSHPSVAQQVRPQQSWALEVFLNFFSIIKNVFFIFHQVNLTGSGIFLNGAETGYWLDKMQKKIMFYYCKKYQKCPALGNCQPRRSLCL